MIKTSPNIIDRALNKISRF